MAWSQRHKQTQVQVDFIRALGALMQEQNHTFSAGLLSVMEGDTLIFEGVYGLEQRDVGHLHFGAGGTSAGVDRGGETEFSLRLRLIRSGSEIPYEDPKQIESGFEADADAEEILDPDDVYHPKTGLPGGMQ